MADTNTTVHIGENSPEQVAYKLMRDIATVEGRSMASPNAAGASPTKADRKYILRTYYECLQVIRGYEPAP